MATDRVTLADVVRQAGGFGPIRLDRVAAVLERADAMLPGGRDCRDALTDEQVRHLLVGELEDKEPKP